MVTKAATGGKGLVVRIHSVNNYLGKFQYRFR